MPYDITDAMKDILTLDDKIESLAQAVTELINELQAKKVIEKPKEDEKETKEVK